MKAIIEFSLYTENKQALSILFSHVSELTKLRNYYLVIYMYDMNSIPPVMYVFSVAFLVLVLQHF